MLITAHATTNNGFVECISLLTSFWAYEREMFIVSSVYLKVPFWTYIFMNIS